MSLVDLLEQIDTEQEELTKQAQEEEAAGRIMARGFMDELSKLAQQGPVAPAPAVKPPPSLKKGKIKHTNQSITTAMPGGGSQTHYPQKNLTIKRPKESVQAFAKSLK